MVLLSSAYRANISLGYKNIRKIQLNLSKIYLDISHNPKI